MLKSHQFLIVWWWSIMDEIDLKILAAIDKVSPKFFVSPVKVNEVLGLDETELGDRLMLLKKSGHVDILTGEYSSSLTLPNLITKVYLTDLGRQSLKEAK
jgi:RIO-like serine/threonine protein kinase